MYSYGYRLGEYNGPSLHFYISTEAECLVFHKSFLTLKYPYILFTKNLASNTKIIAISTMFIVWTIDSVIY